jgi:hypothetical protein
MTMRRWCRAALVMLRGGQRHARLDGWSGRRTPETLWPADQQYLLRLLPAYWGALAVSAAQDGAWDQDGRSASHKSFRPKDGMKERIRRRQLRGSSRFALPLKRRGEPDTLLADHGAPELSE